MYDPSRDEERAFATKLKQQLERETVYHVRMNYPYQGISDGHTSFIRKQLSSEEYVGIELEINQAISTSRYFLEVGIKALARAILQGVGV